MEKIKVEQLKKEKSADRRDASKYATGFSDNLQPLEALDLGKINNFDELAKAMSKTSFGGRSLGEAADVLYEMASDKDCFVVGTFAGAMTVAKMGLLICDMIDRGMLNAIVSTGALMTHGFVESIGMRHFKHNPKMDDVKLYEKGYNRVYDTLELEKNLDDTEEIVTKVLDKIDKNEVLCSYEFTSFLGKYLSENADGRAILKSAYSKKVPVYIPAFTDSELGLDLGIYMKKQAIKGEKPFQFNPFLDLEHYTEQIKNAKKVGIFTIGGGVPRNWAQQVAPYWDLVLNRILKTQNPNLSKKEEEKSRTIAGYRSAIGRGTRSEKIRTYNFPQDRLTDHRISKSWHNLPKIMDGEIDDVINANYEI